MFDKLSFSSEDFVGKSRFENGVHKDVTFNIRYSSKDIKGQNPRNVPVFELEFSKVVKNEDGSETIFQHIQQEAVFTTKSFEFLTTVILKNIVGFGLGGTPKNKEIILNTFARSKEVQEIENIQITEQQENEGLTVLHLQVQRMAELIGELIKDKMQPIQIKIGNRTNDKGYSSSGVYFQLNGYTGNNTMKLNYNPVTEAYVAKEKPVVVQHVIEPVQELDVDDLPTEETPF
jgi:hypothetical protein